MREAIVRLGTVGDVSRAYTCDKVKRIESVFDRQCSSVCRGWGHSCQLTHCMNLRILKIEVEYYANGHVDGTRNARKQNVDITMEGLRTKEKVRQQEGKR